MYDDTEAVPTLAAGLAGPAVGEWCLAGMFVNLWKPLLLAIAMNFGDVVVQLLAAPTAALLGSAAASTGPWRLVYGTLSGASHQRLSSCRTMPKCASDD